MITLTGTKMHLTCVPDKNSQKTRSTGEYPHLQLRTPTKNQELTL